MLAVPDDRRDRDAVATGVADALEGVVIDDHLDEAVKFRYVSDRGREIPER